MGGLRFTWHGLIRSDGCGAHKTERSAGLVGCVLALLGPELEWLHLSCFLLDTKSTVVHSLHWSLHYPPFWHYASHHVAWILPHISPIIPELFLILSASYFSQNIPRIISAGLTSILKSTVPGPQGQSLESSPEHSSCHTVQVKDIRIIAIVPLPAFTSHQP